MNCSTTNCNTIQIIEPDDTLLTSVSSGGRDQSLDEIGSTLVTTGPTARQFITFETEKASLNYRFEWLYIETPGISNPGNVEPVVVDKTPLGFLVDYAGLPLADGYILQWRVVVLTGVPVAVGVDTAEDLRLRLPRARIYTATFVFPRSTNSYGFSELRVENLVAPADSQRLIGIQVVGKTTLDFTIGLNPLPDSDDYYLVARTP